MATIAEKSRTKEIIDRLQGIINSASPMPLGAGKIVIYKDEVQSLLTELATQMDIELKTYHEVNDRKGKIINEAKKEAEQIIYQAEHSASRMRVNKRATSVAPLDYEQLDEEERSALGNANEIYAASLIYTDEMLTEVTDMIADAYHNIRSDYEVILQVMEEKLNVINGNRAELMNGLQEMEIEDRGQQILEIGQLLSNELYNSRMKAKMNSDEYEDGSVQLRLDLQEEQEEKTRQAEAVAEQAVAALAEVTAERDALMATVNQMKQEGMRQAVRNMKAGAGMAAVTTAADKPKPPQNTGGAFVQTNEESVVKSSNQDEEEEYEIVYVTEDELEEGEEYEIEYIDDVEAEETSVRMAEDQTVKTAENQLVKNKGSESAEEEKVETEVSETENKMPAKGMAQRKMAGTMKESLVKDKQENVAGSVSESETVSRKETDREDSEKVPIIPHFKKSEKIASADSGQIAKMATAITTEKKYSGLISRAVAEREKAEQEVVVEEETLPKAETMHKTEQKAENSQPNKDEDIKKDANGNEYIQATMKFDEDYEIMEF